MLNLFTTRWQLIGRVGTSWHTWAHGASSPSLFSPLSLSSNRLFVDMSSLERSFPFDVLVGP